MWINKVRIREGRDTKRQGYEKTRREEECWKALLYTYIAIWEKQNQEYIKLKCHFSAIFPLFGAISSHISIGGQRKSKGEKDEKKT